MVGLETVVVNGRGGISSEAALDGNGGPQQVPRGTLKLVDIHHKLP